MQGLVKIGRSLFLRGKFSQWAYHTRRFEAFENIAELSTPDSFCMRHFN